MKSLVHNRQKFPRSIPRHLLPRWAAFNYRCLVNHCLRQKDKAMTSLSKELIKESDYWVRGGAESRRVAEFLRKAAAALDTKDALLAEARRVLEPLAATPLWTDPDSKGDEILAGGRISVQMVKNARAILAKLAKLKTRGG